MCISPLISQSFPFGCTIQHGPTCSQPLLVCFHTANPQTHACAHNTAMACYKPDTQQRQQALQLQHSALLYIDVQNYNCHPSGALYANQNAMAAENTYWWQRIKEATPLWQQLQQQCRKAQVEVMYTVIMSLTNDGRDRSLDYKISGFHVPPGSWAGEMIEAIQPLPTEMILPKTSSSVFCSTNIDYLLRNLGVRHLVLCGCVTDQCVEHAVRDACDHGYLVTLVTDACATYSIERHEASLKAIGGYCRQRTTQELCDEIEQLMQQQQQEP